MIVKVLPFALVLVTAFFSSAAIYYFIRSSFSARKAKRKNSSIDVANNSADNVRSILNSKRQTAAGKDGNISALSKILDLPTGLGSSLAASSQKGKLTPPPPTASKRIQASIGKAGRSEVRESTGTLETLIVKMYEDYLGDIAQFQQAVANAASAGEIFNKTCRALSSMASHTRVAYLEYQPPQRALMVNSRSAPNVFAGTQPRMFLPQTGAASKNSKNIPIEELRHIFSHLSQDSELQRLLSDSARLEARSEDQAVLQEQIWESQKKWRIYPLYVRGLPQGIFAVQENSTCQRREFDRIVSILLAQASSAVENIRLHSKMIEVSARDASTGLQTRKVFQDRLYQNFLIARRLQHPLTVLRLDVDHMAAYSKQYGSNVSEALLRHVTRHLERFFRKSDILARYNQDGFAVMLPHTALVDAMKKTEALVQAIGESHLKLGSGDQEVSIRVSVSAGMAEYPSHADNPADLVRFASEAFHRGQGRDRGACTLAKVPTGYVPPFNSRFVRSSPKALQENAVSPILDP